MDEKTLLSIKQVLGRIGLLDISEFAIRSVTSAGREMRAHRQRMLRFYAQFVREGDLCFDVGANLGSRVEVFLRLGATVVAVEPQRQCVDYLRMRYARNRRVILVPAGLADHEGEQTLRINQQDSPTASMSPDHIAAITVSRDLVDYVWDVVETVSVTTLDHLIAVYGKPAFCKIDVEGFEHQVLQGLTQPLGALSFEYTTDFVEPALDCVSYLSRLGSYIFNFSPVESMTMGLSAWTDGTGMHQALARMATNRPSSGDVYALLEDQAGLALDPE
jgi:FkbM family methyltransferase